MRTDNTRTGMVMRPLAIGPVKAPNPVILAPMTGITDAPFRRLSERLGAGLVVSEMTASAALAERRREACRRSDGRGVAINVVQLAGCEARWMAEGARIAEAEGADVIDINMGCPARLVTRIAAGSALMRDLDHALTLIDATVGAVGVPVTLKTRLGWDEQALNAPILARRAEAAGISMITIHGRTRCQFYTGHADWRAIRRVKEAVGVPVVANGDIATAADAACALECSDADAVMVGRGNCGAPWMAASIAAACGGDAARDVPQTSVALAEYVVAHYEAMLLLYGADSGLRQARKHLGWYLDRQAPEVAPETRARILTATVPSLVIRALRETFSDDRADTGKIAA
jgi:nifR3 family TIM-barrel protein